VEGGSQEKSGNLGGAIPGMGTALPGFALPVASSKGSTHHGGTEPRRKTKKRNLGFSRFFSVPPWWVFVPRLWCYNLTNWLII
jgi:hypothetical protein